MERNRKRGIEREPGERLRQQPPHDGRKCAEVAVFQVVDEPPGRPGHLEGGVDTSDVLEMEAPGAEPGPIPAGRAMPAAAGTGGRFEGRFAGGAERGIERPAPGTAERKQEINSGAQEPGRHGRECTGTRPSCVCLYNGGVNVTVLLFASVAERAGTRRIELPHRDGETVGDIRDRLVERFPQLAASVPTLMYAIDEEYARETDVVPAGATLALIPPVSGG